MQDLQLTENFYLSELVKSQTASRLNLNNTPNDTEIKNLKLLCEKVLQPIRDHFNKPVIITSGFRSKVVNNAVGGSSSSQHCFGQAADFDIPGIPNYDLAVWIKESLNYDQLILECYHGGNSGWVHVGYSPRHKNEELTFNGRQYFNGLIK